MNAFALSGFSGLGCDCQLGSVLAYDQIKIGGKTYSVNQIIGKTITASVDTKLYSNPYGQGRVVGTVKAGQPIGIVYSYFRPEQADGRSWLMFDNGTTSFYVPNEVASGTGLKDQGAITVADEIKKEQEEEARRNDPVGYYLKKYGLPVLLIGGGIYLAATYGKAFIQGKLSQAA